MSYSLNRNQEFSEKYAAMKCCVDDLLNEEFATSLHSDELEKIFAYTVLSPGKRLRPILALASAELLGVDRELITPIALAVECLHAASLIHDDLPALDNDDFRRGRPTCHKVFGESNAILGGDALIAKVFEIISRDNQINSNSKVKIIKLIADTTIELCLGQIMDLNGSGKNNELKNKTLLLSDRADVEIFLRDTNLKKTASLIRASILGPLYLVEDAALHAKFENKLITYGTSLGLLFQVTDDILDSGKDVSHRTAKESALSLANKANEAMSSFGEKGKFLVDLCNHILNRTN